MPQVEDVKVLNIDGVPYAVDGMSDAVKQMVGIYNDWNVQEAEARNKLMMVQAAKNDLSRQIIMQVRNEKAEAEKAAAAAEAAPAPAPAAPAPAPAAPAPAPAVNTTEAPPAPAEEPAAE